MRKYQYRSMVGFVSDGSRHVIRQVLSLLKDHIFVALTLLGNSYIVINALIFYYLEHESNPHLKSFIDALWWGVATVTTVGYGDVVPVTMAGKIHGIFMMLSGVAIFMSFTALFARSVLGQDLEEVEIEIRRLEKDVQRLRNEIEVATNQDENKK